MSRGSCGSLRVHARAAPRRSRSVQPQVQLALWRRRAPAGHTVAHSDPGAHYTSWAFGRRLRAAELLGSMRPVGDAYDNSVIDSRFGTLQVELLDQHHWADRQQLALAPRDDRTLSPNASGFVPSTGCSEIQPHLCQRRDPADDCRSSDKDDRPLDRFRASLAVLWF
jgi:transposase InsO family protein